MNANICVVCFHNITDDIIVHVGLYYIVIESQLRSTIISFRCLGANLVWGTTLAQAASYGNYANLRYFEQHFTHMTSV